MVITKKYAKKLVKEGKATISGKTTTNGNWEERNNGGRIYVIVIRHDLQRTDHYKEW